MLRTPKVAVDPNANPPVQEADATQKEQHLVSIKIIF